MLWVAQSGEGAFVVFVTRMSHNNQSAGRVSMLKGNFNLKPTKKSDSTNPKFAYIGNQHQLADPYQSNNNQLEYELLASSLKILSNGEMDMRNYTTNCKKGFVKLGR